MKSISELRLDLVSNDWVVIATGRAKRPETFAKDKRIKETISPKDCPFCQSAISKRAVLRYNQPNNDWGLIVIPNDYPVFSFGGGLNRRNEGPNKLMDGFGFHEVIITHHHQKQFAQFSQKEIKQVIDAYQARYLYLMRQKFIRYISIFHNHGQEAGASIIHPHSQLIAIPVMDPDLRGSILGAKKYYENNKKCVYCVMIEWDLKDGRRIIYENEKFAVLSPFAPQVSFEIRVYPKEHLPYFEKIGEKEKELFAEALGLALNKLYHCFNDPAYNFYIHTAPCDNKDYQHYHWHLVILPKTAISAGFELGAGIEISTIEPERAAKLLREQ